MNKNTKTLKEPQFLPERIEDECPICPWCGNIFSDIETTFEDIDCSCGMTFEVERKLCYVSRPLEYRK